MLDKIVSWFCISIVTLMTILVTYQVVVRYVFNSPSVSVRSAFCSFLVYLVSVVCSALVFGSKKNTWLSLFIKEKFQNTNHRWMFIELGDCHFRFINRDFRGYSSSNTPNVAVRFLHYKFMGTIYACSDSISGVLMVSILFYNELQNRALEANYVLSAE